MNIPVDRHGVGDATMDHLCCLRHRPFMTGMESTKVRQGTKGFTQNGSNWISGYAKDRTVKDSGAMGDARYREEDARG